MTTGVNWSAWGVATCTKFTRKRECMALTAHCPTCSLRSSNWRLARPGPRRRQTRQWPVAPSTGLDMRASRTGEQVYTCRLRRRVQHADLVHLDQLQNFPRKVQGCQYVHPDAVLEASFVTRRIREFTASMRTCVRAWLACGSSSPSVAIQDTLCEHDELHRTLMIMRRRRLSVAECAAVAALFVSDLRSAAFSVQGQGCATHGRRDTNLMLSILPVQA